jgi:hypothetical protein
MGGLGVGNPSLQWEEAGGQQLLYRIDLEGLRVWQTLGVWWKAKDQSRANSEMGMGPKVWQTLGRGGGIYIYIHIYTHTHTHTHIYIYIHIYIRWGWGLESGKL